MGDIAKRRMLVIGGKAFNIPKQLHDHFNIVKQIEQDERRVPQLPHVDYVLCITNWVNHGAIATARKQIPNVPMIWVRKGWNAMRAELVRRGLIPDEVPDATEAEEVETAVEPEMSVEDDVPVEIEDPLASVSEEELERMTRPEEAQRPVAVQAAGVASDILPEWKAWVGLWAEKVSDKIGMDSTSIAALVLSVDEPTPQTFKDGFGIDDDAAYKLWISFGKSRGHFRGSKGMSPVPPRRTPMRTLSPIAGSSVLPSGPVTVLPSDTMALVNLSRKLVERKSAIKGQIETLQEDIEKIDKQLEELKPFLSAVEQLQRVTKQVSEKMKTM